MVCISMETRFLKEEEKKTLLARCNEEQRAYLPAIQMYLELEDQK